jgi:hypothetical protein
VVERVRFAAGFCCAVEDDAESEPTVLWLKTPSRQPALAAETHRVIVAMVAAAWIIRRFI